MDLATLLGLLIAFALVGMAIFMGGEITAFLDIPSVLIVVLGTFAVTTVSFTLKEIIVAQGLMFKALLYPQVNAQKAAKDLLDLAQKARTTGLLSIQNEARNAPSRYLKTGLSMAVDGVAPDVIERVMRTDLAGMIERHARGVAVLRRSAEIAPAMGLIGTLIGLVQMLGNLDNPAAIGPAMAVALLTTLYGAVLSNMFFLPVAAKLEAISAEEVMIRKINMTGVLAIARQENPRQLEMLLNTLLPPSLRLALFD
ncbi:MAG: MotA/TolQ/ExbB proton channel family protein [Alphaproteobacteria bacterium]